MSSHFSSFSSPSGNHVILNKRLPNYTKKKQFLRIQYSASGVLLSILGFVAFLLLCKASQLPLILNTIFATAFYHCTRSLNAGDIYNKTNICPSRYNYEVEMALVISRSSFTQTGLHAPIDVHPSHVL